MMSDHVEAERTGQWTMEQILRRGRQMWVMANMGLGALGRGRARRLQEGCAELEAGNSQPGSPSAVHHGHPRSAHRGSVLGVTWQMQKNYTH